jgi:hypothetical protein
MKRKQLKSKLKKFNFGTDCKRIFHKNEIVFGVSLLLLFTTGFLATIQHQEQNLHGSAPIQTMQEKYPTDPHYQPPGRAYSYQESNNDPKLYIEL